jgi:hypothetical protein
VTDKHNTASGTLYFIFPDLFLLQFDICRLVGAFRNRGPNGENLDFNCVRENEVSGSAFIANLKETFDGPPPLPLHKANTYLAAVSFFSDSALAKCRGTRSLHPISVSVSQLRRSVRNTSAGNVCIG